MCGIFLASFEISARVDHVAVEPEPIEIGGEVVVISYRCGIAGHCGTTAANHL
jgi:hypothetical protein